MACLANFRKAAAKLDVLVAARAFAEMPLVTVMEFAADWLNGVTVAVVRLARPLAELTIVRGGGLVPGGG